MKTPPREKDRAVKPSAYREGRGRHAKAILRPSRIREVKTGSHQISPRREKRNCKRKGGIWRGPQEHAVLEHTKRSEIKKFILLGGKTPGGKGEEKGISGKGNTTSKNLSVNRSAPQESGGGPDYL